jgi:hypothetical protein
VVSKAGRPDAQTHEEDAMRRSSHSRIGTFTAVAAAVLLAGYGAPARAQELQCKPLRGTKAIQAILAHRTLQETGALPCGVEKPPPADRCLLTEITDIAESATVTAAFCNAANYSAQCATAATNFDDKCTSECAQYQKKVARTPCEGIGRPKTPRFPGPGSCPQDPDTGLFEVTCTVTGSCICDP